MPQSNPILEVFPLLEKLEKTMEEFYTSCASAWPQDAACWESLARQENKHAVYVKKAAELILRSPGEYSAGRAYNPAGVRTVLKGIEENMEKIRERRIPFRRALFLSRDIEKSLIEMKFLEIVVSKNLEFMHLMELVNAETDEHQAALDKKIAELP